MLSGKDKLRLELLNQVRRGECSMEQYVATIRQYECDEARQGDTTMNKSWLQEELNRVSLTDRIGSGLETAIDELNKVAKPVSSMTDKAIDKVSPVIKQVMNVAWDKSVDGIQAATDATAPIVRKTSKSVLGAVKGIVKGARDGWNQ